MTTAPLARFAVTIIGSISGVRPTATATPNRNACSQSPLDTPLITKTIGTITSMNRMSSQLTLFTPMSNDVTGRRPMRLLAIAPKYVRSPVAMTTAAAVPLTTDVPRKPMLRSSPNVTVPEATSTGASPFSTGTASPVSAD